MARLNIQDTEQRVERRFITCIPRRSKHGYLILPFRSHMTVPFHSKVPWKVIQCSQIGLLFLASPKNPAFFRDFESKREYKWFGNSNDLLDQKLLVAYCFFSSNLTQGSTCLFTECIPLL